MRQACNKPQYQERELGVRLFTAIEGTLGDCCAIDARIKTDSKLALSKSATQLTV
jgi:hypothetical protein